MCLITGKKKNTGWSKGYSSGTGTEGEAGSGASWRSEVAVPGAGHPQVGAVDAQARGYRDAAGIPGTRSPYRPRPRLARAEPAARTEPGLIKSF